VICGQRGVDFARLRANSLFISADAAHARHPNFPGIRCKKNRTPAGTGVVIKRTYTGSYAYDERGLALVIEAAKRSGARFTYVGSENRSGGGGTIGPIVEATLSLPTIDIGPPVWGMHSHREMMAWRDVEDLTTLLTYVYGHFAELHAWSHGS